MKKFLLIVLVFLFTNNAFSQAKYGVKAGVNFSSLSDVKYNIDGAYLFTQFEKKGMTIGYHAGVFANISLGSILNFQPELLFSMQGGKIQEYSGMLGGSGEWAPALDLLYQLGYIQVPLLFEIIPITNLGILVGAQLSFNLSRKCTSTYKGHTDIFSGSELSENFYGSGLKRYDAGLVCGLQYTFMEKISIGVRYNLGLLNNWNFTASYDETQTSKGWKSGVIQISMGFCFK